MNLSDRMKHNYEEVAKFRLTRRTPVIIRLDGKAFHTFTRGLQKPFDEIFIKTMQDTMKYLCENIQGCVLGYTQSDEISLVLTDYEKLTTDAWFDYEVQKMCSVSASLATLEFNKAFERNVAKFKEEMNDASIEVDDTYMSVLERCIEKGATFDSRCFNIPKEEVINCIFWRQDDATKNSILSVGQANFSQKELDKKSRQDIQEMLWSQKGINWNDFPTHQKRGCCCIRAERGWTVDLEIPIFVNEGREYVEKLI